MLMGEFIPKPKYRYVLRKLPLWGDQVADDELNFEWPTQAQFDKLGPDVRLQSIELKGDYDGWLSYVKCNLSDGTCSPIFASSATSHPMTVNFDKDKPIRSVSAKDNNGAHIADLQFFDEKVGLLYEYKPINNRGEAKARPLGENEDIIGVYGVKTNYSFTSFGFIVRAKLVE